MLTGRHFVRDVFCKKCAVKLGWIYEFATDDSQRYKEGLFKFLQFFVLM
jgi:protein yippee-like 5